MANLKAEIGGNGGILQISEYHKMSVISGLFCPFENRFGCVNGRIDCARYNGIAREVFGPKLWFDDPFGCTLQQQVMNPLRSGLVLSYVKNRWKNSSV